MNADAAKPFARLTQTDGPAWDLYAASCPKCGAAVGVAHAPGTIAWVGAGPPVVVFDAIHGPGHDGDGVAFAPHRCPPPTWPADFGRRTPAEEDRP
jgi:hypothetical protein